MWYLLLIAMTNIACGYLLAVFLGYASMPQFASLRFGRSGNASVEIPDISEDDVVVAEHPHPEEDQ